ncbi:hypothetical protein [Acetohalobium arabaticum]|uniref:Uncharacterized protein n=1 Tax=Acetohalobium arabaticum (strain ATCC 49924 / DSM 5501 / Z-7288) TaxID=574087 RepID=D9QPW0_ACEAZ|nr:hypothetical protein [Acetohalobium arabaticum]ADL12551.1 hypothetical protein Acear_1025 [Acetohalobium arabaticum DSM 5501]
MFRGFYNFILRLIERIESLLIKGTISLLILLITVQIALNDPLSAKLQFENSYLQQLKEIPVVQQVVTYLQRNNSGVKQTAELKEVTQSESVTTDKQGIVELKVLNSTTDQQIKVFINKKLRKTFSKGQARILVEPGDKIILDTRGINKGLWFQVTALSDNLQNFNGGERFWIKNDLYTLEEVKVRKRY